MSCLIARYCDLVAGPQHRADAELFRRDFQERLAKFGFELYPEKTLGVVPAPATAGLVERIRSVAIRQRAEKKTQQASANRALSPVAKAARTIPSGPQLDLMLVTMNGCPANSNKRIPKGAAAVFRGFKIYAGEIEEFL